MHTRLLAMVLICWFSPATAANDVGVVVVGEATLLPEVSARMEEWLRNRGDQLIASALPPDAVNAMVDCFVLDDESCARSVVEKRAKAQSIVYARIDASPIGEEASPGARDVEVVAYWFEKGRDPVAEKRYCEQCTASTLGALTDDVLAALVRSRRVGVGRLELSSRPAHARVMLDGRLIGVTPLSYELSPGTHTVALSRDRHEVATRKVAIRGGETTELHVPLVPAGSGRSRALPIIVLAGGVTAAVAGGVLLAIDEDASPTAPLEIRNTAPAGVALLTGGAALVATGAYLWLRGNDAGPTVAASADGVALGWFARF